MPDSKRFLHPEAISRISRMDLRARRIVEGFLAGHHRSPYYGQSIEFLQHREYAPGDDIRHIDWKVWARQNRYYVKQFEEDTNLRCMMLIDASQSMEYGSGALSKYEYACTSAVALAYLLLNQQDAVGCVTFDDDIRHSVAPKSRSDQLHAIINLFDSTRPSDKTDLGQVLLTATQSVQSRGIVMLFSDLFAPREGLLRGLRLLRQRQQDVVLFHIMDDDELDFTFHGSTRFEGLETSEQLNCNPRALREEYLNSVQKFLREIQRGCASLDVDYSLIRTSQHLDAVLAAFLLRRYRGRAGLRGRSR